MKIQFAKCKPGGVSPLILLFLILLAGLTNCTAQKQPPGTSNTDGNWSISFSQITGRFLYDSINYQINSDGKIFFRYRQQEPGQNGKFSDVRKNGEISPEAVAELDALVKNLDLSKAKPIPADQMRSCQPTLHWSPLIADLQIGGQRYQIKECSGFKGTSYSLILSDEQREIYQQLKKTALAHFDQYKAKPRKRLRYLFTANGGLIGFFSDGSVAACPRCDLNQENVAALNEIKPYATYQVEKSFLLIDGNEKMEFYSDGKISPGWAILDYEKLAQF